MGQQPRRKKKWKKGGGGGSSASSLSAVPSDTFNHGAEDDAAKPQRRWRTSSGSFDGGEVALSPKTSNSNGKRAGNLRGKRQGKGAAGLGQGQVETLSTVRIAFAVFLAYNWGIPLQSYIVVAYACGITQRGVVTFVATHRTMPEIM